MNIDKITAKLVDFLKNEYPSIISVYSDKGEYSMTVSHTQEDFKFQEKKTISRSFINDDLSISFNFNVTEGVVYFSFISSRDSEESFSLKSDNLPLPIPTNREYVLDWNQDYVVNIGEGKYKFWISLRNYTN